MVLTHSVRVPADVLAWLVRAEGLGELHTVLSPEARWLPKPTRVGLELGYHEELHRFGPVDRHGQLDIEVLASLAVLCRATTEFYGWISTGESVKGVLAAAISREAVLAVRAGDEVSVRQVGRNVLAEVLVAQTPEVRAGRGAAVTVVRADVLATSGGRMRSPSGVVLRPASPQVRLVKEIAALPTVGGGELYVAVRDGVGRRRTVDQPLRYADTPRGRFLNQVTVTGGETKLRVAPAGPADLVAGLTKLHRSLSR